MRPSREGKKTGVHPEGDENLMFPLEMEEQPWKRTSKTTSPKGEKCSTGVGRSQPMDISKRTPTKNIPVVKKKERAHLQQDPKPNPDSYSDSSNLKKPSRPHHFARLSVGDLGELSDEDDNYDIDPEASEVQLPLPSPSPAEIKEREQFVALQRQIHIHAVEVPRSQSPPVDLQFLCQDMKQKRQQLTVPSSPSAFAKQSFEKQKPDGNPNPGPTTAVSIVLPTVTEETKTVTNKVIIKNALAIAVREAKEKKLQATVMNVVPPPRTEKKEIMIKKDPKIYYSDSDEDQPWVDLPIKNSKKKKKKKRKV